MNPRAHLPRITGAVCAPRITQATGAKRAARALAPASLLVLLAACTSSSPPPKPPSAPPSPVARVTPAPAAGAAMPGQRAHFDNIDAYKADVAEHIMRSNTARTFSHPLPPMLPAIVVVNISIDRDGALSRVSVQRSRDSQASAVALAAVRQCGKFPRPMNLAPRSGTLDFSETFLFNAQYQFKLRTLAGVQPTE